MLNKKKLYSISKIALGVEYNGTKYNGWQIQKNENSIEKYLKIAIENIAQENIKIYCGGRTDSGVHAIGQVIHFNTSKVRKNSAWSIGVNTYLPDDIAVNWSKKVDFDFHARFSAKSRRYCYIILNHECKSGIFNEFIAHYPKPLDVEKMQIAANSLLGERDFTSFRSKKCQSRSPFRKIKNIIINRYGNYILIDIEANSFLYNMVRNIVGSLLEIGYGKRKVTWLSDLLMYKDRSMAASTAKPNGLYLVSIKYPSKYKLPKSVYSYFSIKYFYFKYIKQIKRKH